MIDIIQGERLILLACFDLINPTEFDGMVKRNADLGQLLADRKPDKLHYVKTFKALIMSRLKPYTGSQALALMKAERPQHYAALIKAPGGTIWLSAQLESVKRRIDAL